jgi:hypothetical protein
MAVGVAESVRLAESGTGLVEAENPAKRDIDPTEFM